MKTTVYKNLKHEYTRKLKQNDFQKKSFVFDKMLTESHEDDKCRVYDVSLKIGVNISIPLYSLPDASDEEQNGIYIERAYKQIYKNLYSDVDDAVHNIIESILDCDRDGAILLCEKLLESTRTGFSND